MSFNASPDPLGPDHHAVPLPEAIGGMPTQSAGDLASILRLSSPLQARSFAVAMHERGCEQGNWEEVDLWSDVLDHL